MTRLTDSLHTRLYPQVIQLRLLETGTHLEMGVRQNEGRIGGQASLTFKKIGSHIGGKGMLLSVLKCRW